MIFIAVSLTCGVELCSKLGKTQEFFCTKKKNRTEATVYNFPQNHLNDLKTRHQAGFFGGAPD